MDKLKKILMEIETLTPEEVKVYFEEPEVPYGWVSVDDHLPMMAASDFESGGTRYLVKNDKGEEFTSFVSDHNVWFQIAKTMGITHWYNEQADVIEFRGEYDWLSNFYPVSITLNDITYPSVEHAYMSCKNNSIEWKIQCSDKSISPNKIKRMGNKIPLRDDWEEVKIDVMRLCLEEKFKQEPFKTKLLNTKSLILQEGNRWGDVFWGVDLKTKEGQNVLGNLIMIIRAKLLYCL